MSAPTGTPLDDAQLAEVASLVRRVATVSLATDWTTPATAAALGLSCSGVRTALVRAMAQLGAELGIRSPNPLASPLSQRDHTRRRLRACSARRARTGVPHDRREVRDVQLAA